MDIEDQSLEDQDLQDLDDIPIPDPELDDLIDEGILLDLPSGAEFRVLTQREVEYLESRAAKYLSQTRFDHVSDLAEVDRIVTMEMLCYRYSLWLTMMVDYSGDPIDDKTTRTHIDELSKEIRNLKKSLGLDKVGREKDQNTESVQSYIAMLGAKAKEFGIHREAQLGKALELINQLAALMTLNANTAGNPDEQRDLQCTDENVLTWIRDVCIPAYNALDEHFTHNQQRFWVRQI
jgi:hypothetical protein